MKMHMGGDAEKYVYSSLEINANTIISSHNFNVVLFKCVVKPLKILFRNAVKG